MLRAGIVGLPNVGKSTLFNAVTKTRKAAAENYPFCTIEPNVGVVIVPDARLGVLAKMENSARIVPAAIEFVDIAGLVKGASQGEGLGNQFLSHIREVDAIVQVVRCFEDSNIVHVAGGIDPLQDIQTILVELILADLGSLQKQVTRLEKNTRGGDKVAAAELQLLKKIEVHLDAGKPAATLDMTAEERALAKNFFLLSSKPTIFACNVAENELGHAENNKYVKVVREYAKAHHDTEAVVISAKIESDLVDLSESEAAEFLKELGVKESGMGEMIKGVYHLLGLITYFTAGEKETRAWTIHRGDKAPQAAGVIHTDFERGFIRAEVVSYDDLSREGSYASVREKGKLRLEGKEYVVQDGDVMIFRFNV
jgi:GTP-binding protein YchF